VHHITWERRAPQRQPTATPSNLHPHGVHTCGVPCTQVYTRSGSPTVPADLLSVAAQNAASVIVLSPATTHPPTEFTAAEGAAPAHTAVALATLASSSLSQKNVVFQSPVQVSLGPCAGGAACDKIHVSNALGANSTASSANCLCLG
jgi:hypothetical protein